MKISSQIKIVLIIIVCVLTIGILARSQTIGLFLIDKAVAQAPSRPTPDAPSKPTEKPTEKPNPTSAPNPSAEPSEPSGRKRASSSPKADPAIQVQSRLMPVRSGDTVDFTFDIINNRDGKAQDVVVTSKLPSFLHLTNVSTTWGRVTTEGNVAAVTIETLLPNDVVTVHIHARVIRRALPPYNSNTVVLTSSTKDENVENNQVTFLLWTFSDLK